MSAWLESLRDRLAPQVFEAAMAESDQGGDPADFLLTKGHMERLEVLASLSAFHDRPAMLLSGYRPEDRAISKVPEDTARRYGIVPLFIVREKLYVATPDPDNLVVEDYVRQLTGLPMEAVVTTRDSVLQKINHCYLGGDRSREMVQTMSTASKPREGAGAPPLSPVTTREVDVDDATSPAVKSVDYIISTGLRLGASDIHVEACATRILLRYRIDGVLREYPAPPLELARAITSRIKIISELDVAERRLPQDGRTTFELEGIPYDLRISIIPNIYGESVVVRILASSAEVRDLAAMGFSPPVMKSYVRLISQPHGVLLVTGPTGSGKSATLYATLKHILTPEKKILALEDPVESRIEGVTQFQMNPGIGFTFARCLRSVLRHDPEVVLVGEIRDQETAEIAIRASLTGHMIFSTLHTNDACSAPTRLVDMGVEGTRVMTSLLGVLAQRLVRRLCLRCKAPLQLDASHVKAAGLDSVPENTSPFQSVGCSECQNLGYRGRTAVHELLEINTEMRRLSPRSLTTEQIFGIARRGGFVTLRECGVEKWLHGVTGLEEILKLTTE